MYLPMLRTGRIVFCRQFKQSGHILVWSEILLMLTEGQSVTGERVQSSYNLNEMHRPPALTGHLHNGNHDTEMALLLCLST